MRRLNIRFSSTKAPTSRIVLFCITLLMTWLMNKASTEVNHTSTYNDAALSAIAEQVLQRLLAQGQTMATAESCTGGWISKLMTDLPGSSAAFYAGLVCYSNAAKERVLSVSVERLVEHGAVSEPVAEAMAVGARVMADVDIAVAVTGIAGPGGGSADKPVGTVCFSWSTADGADTQTLCLAGDRDAVRRQTAIHALQGVLARLPS